MNEEYYMDWLSDHHQGLLEDFAEEHQDLFDKYCKTKFCEWKENR